MHRLRYRVIPLTRTVRFGPWETFALSRGGLKAEKTPYGKSSFWRVPTGQNFLFSDHLSEIRDGFSHHAAARER